MLLELTVLSKILKLFVAFNSYNQGIAKID